MSRRSKRLKFLKIYNKVMIVLIFMMLAGIVVTVRDIDQTYCALVREDMHRISQAFDHCFADAAADITVTAKDSVLYFENAVDEKRWHGPVLSKGRGVNQGPSGKETYYNLNMSVCVRMMHNLGYNYEYWVRDDGVKMFGDYVMIAANLKIRPKGSVVMTSLGPGMVCDTGTFAKRNPTQIDIATTW